jgi:hypothetical protein
MLLVHTTCNEACDEYDHWEGEQLVTEPFVAERPHQCEGWVIGGQAEVRALIDYLQHALAALDAGAAPVLDSRK